MSSVYLVQLALMVSVKHYQKTSVKSIFQLPVTKSMNVGESIVLMDNSALKGNVWLLQGTVIRDIAQIKKNVLMESVLINVPMWSVLEVPSAMKENVSL